MFDWLNLLAPLRGGKQVTVREPSINSAAVIKRKAVRGTGVSRHQGAQSRPSLKHIEHHTPHINMVLMSLKGVGALNGAPR